MLVHLGSRWEERLGKAKRLTQDLQARSVHTWVGIRAIQFLSALAAALGGREVLTDHSHPGSCSSPCGSGRVDWKTKWTLAK